MIGVGVGGQTAVYLDRWQRSEWLWIKIDITTCGRKEAIRMNGTIYGWRRDSIIDTEKNCQRKNRSVCGLFPYKSFYLIGGKGTKVEAITISAYTIIRSTN